MFRALDVFTSTITTLGRLGTGHQVAKLGPRPERVLELYEFEACPFCRKVREALSLLDLDARVRPCPKNGPTYRPWVAERGGKMQFPYLVDPNTDRSMYESDDIVAYLFEQYGVEPPPLALRAGPITDVSAALSGLARFAAGGYYRRARAPERPLELYSFEASPFSRLVRETLCELEIPYDLRNVARGSPKREAFQKRSGKMQVPWLSDPNTGTELFESADIVAYLNDTYAL